MIRRPVSRPTRARIALSVAATALFGAAVASQTIAAPAPPRAPVAASGAMVKGPEAFNSIADPKARSVALFGEMAKVIESPRCLNCHPRTDTPTQGDAMTVHSPPVSRGMGGMGVPGMTCNTCHGEANFTFANGEGSIPGDPAWALAPPEMAWAGKTRGEICRQLKDPARNGNKTMAELVEHNTHDHLVGWGWNPGHGRMPAPGTQAQFGALTAAWVASGAHCPD